MSNTDTSLVAKLNRFLFSRKGIILAGLVIGILAPTLQYLGNPGNMGICVACFERDIAGALGLHRAAVVQYIRPEIIGFILGAFVAALMFGEFKPRAGSAPIMRFLLGMFAMIGALAFLGCPWRALLRLAGGDFNAIVGLAGLIVGVSIGAIMLKRGYSLGRSRPMSRVAGYMMPLIALVLLGFVAFKVSFKDGQAIFFSAKGPGSMHAALLISLGVGLVVGILAQRTRFCTMGAIRDVVLIKDFHLISGLAALLVGAFVMNLIFGQFNTGFTGQPVSHSNHLWNFLGMTLAGLAFALAGGCPGRQLFLSGEGDGDASIFVVGMVIGAAFAHNFFLAGSPDKMTQGVLAVGGPGQFGQIAVIVGLLFCLVVGFTARSRN